MSFFNGHYNCYGFHPLLIFDAETADLLVAHLRPGNVGAAEGIVPLLEGIVLGVRAKWPGLRILFRGDAGFATPELYDWCEDNGVEYVIGLGVNPVLKRLSAWSLESAKAKYKGGNLPDGEVGKTFEEFRYKAESWRSERRVIAKAEVGALGDNQRYVVTNLKSLRARKLYEFYCERGRCENMIKDLKNALAGDRLSCSAFLPNAFRLMMHAVAYRLCLALGEEVNKLTGEIWQFDTLRLRLLKVAGSFVNRARKIVIHLPEAFPLAGLWAALAHALAPPGAHPA